MERLTRLFLATALMIVVAPILLGGRGPARTGDESAAMSEARIVSSDAPRDPSLSGVNTGLPGLDDTTRPGGSIEPAGGLGMAGYPGAGIAVPGAIPDSLLESPRSQLTPAEPRLSFRQEASSWEKLCLLFRQGV